MVVVRRSLLALLALLAACGGRPEATTDPEPLVGLAAHDEHVADAALRLSRAARRTIVMPPEVATYPVSVAVPAGTPWRLAAADLAAAAGLAVEPLAPRALVLRPPEPRLSLWFDDASGRTVTQLAASYGGLNVVLAPGALDVGVSVEVREVPALDLLHALARVGRTSLSSAGGVFVFGAAETEPLPAPAPAGRSAAPPGPAVRAVRAPASPLLRALAALGGAALVVGGEAVQGGVVSFEQAEGPSGLDAVERLAAAHGWRLEQVGEVFVLHTGPGLPVGEVLAADAPSRLQATILAAPPRALIDGRWYAPGDTLLDRDDMERQGVRLAAVEAGAATIEVAGGEPLRLALE
ncbi:MAG: hypothetical protein KF878_28180 [Planctomycetes bacterium]|nr:hypothetical protein [Planctomycetota bacterium]